MATYPVINKESGEQKEVVLSVHEWSKWCDDNPTETHNSFESLVFTILFQLPIEDCE